MRVFTIGSALTLLAASAASAAGPVSPVALVRGLYAREAPPSRIERVFAADLAQAYRKDTGVPGEVGAIDFDWRYGAQDFRITGLKVGFAPSPPLVAGTTQPPDLAYVSARFRNMGKPTTVFYRLCRRSAGDWRIEDVSADGQDRWDLREMLKLPYRPVRC